MIGPPIVSIIPRMLGLKVATAQQVSTMATDIGSESQNVSAATEEQSASMEEIAAASRTLAGYAEDLQQAAHKFKV